MRFLIIKNLRDDSKEIISVGDSKVDASTVVERWQRNTWDYLAFKRMVPVLYKWSNGKDIVDALIESKDL